MRVPIVTVATAVGVMVVLAGCAPAADEGGSVDEAAGPALEQTSTELLQVTEPHELTGGTLLEGPTFHDDGSLFVVDVMAPAGEAKVLRIDVEEASAEQIFTDETSAFTSAQFQPSDGRLYLTDFLGGGVLSITPDGEDPQVHLTGAVEGVAMLPDDIAFAPDGTMFVTDTRGMDGPGWETPGRVVRIGVIRVPGEGIESATNIAIAPGTTDGYLVVSGPAGGFVHTFEAYGEGTRQSNGG